MGRWGYRDVEGEELKGAYTDPHLTRERCTPWMHVWENVRGQQHTVHHPQRETTFPRISMSHCAKCHRVPGKGCLLNCHNFFNDRRVPRVGALCPFRGTIAIWVRSRGSFPGQKQELDDSLSRRRSWIVGWKVLFVLDRLRLGWEVVSDESCWGCII